MGCSGRLLVSVDRGCFWYCIISIILLTVRRIVKLTKVKKAKERCHSAMAPAPQS